jgi:hypothetical protein
MAWNGLAFFDAGVGWPFVFHGQRLCAMSGTMDTAGWVSTYTVTRPEQVSTGKDRMLRK